MFTDLDAELVSAYSHTRSPHTLSQYRCVLRLFGEHLADASNGSGAVLGELADASLDSLTARDVEGFLAAVALRSSAATARTYGLVLRAVFNFGVRRGLMTAN